MASTEAQALIEAALAKLQAKVHYGSIKVAALEMGKAESDRQVYQIDRRIMELSSRTGTGKQTIGSVALDQQLKQSSVFRSCLQQADQNNRANLRRLQMSLRDTIDATCGKMGEVEERLVGLIGQKERVLRNISFEQERQTSRVTALEDWVRKDERQNSLSSLQDSLRQKLEAGHKSGQLRLELIEERLSVVEQIPQSVTSWKGREENLRNQMRSSLMEEVGEMRARIDRLNEKLRNDVGKITEQCQEFQEKLENWQRKESTVAKIHDPGREQSQQRVIDTQQQILTSLQQQMTQIQQQVTAMQNHQPSTSQQYHNMLPQFTSSEQTQPLAPQMNIVTPQKHNPPVQPITAEQRPKSSAKKELPPRKNWLGRQEAEEEPPASSMQGGIRGLLAKSKGKQRTPSADPVRRGLPPVKQDHNSLKRKQHTQRGWSGQEEEEEDQVVYQIDEEGYLMDEEGNYLLNAQGEMIKLSSEEIDQYVVDQDSY